MSYLLDTNVLSELVRPKPDRSVVRWIEQLPEDKLHLSVLTVGEIRRGVESLRASPRRERLRLWLEEDLPSRFGARLLSVDHGVAERWGRLLAEVSRTVPAIDSLLAATALHHELRLATRNTRDFEYPGLEVVNPWETERG